MTAHARLRLICMLGLALLAVPAMPGSGPRGPQQAIRIPLEPLGYEALSKQFLLAGSSMLTVHFVDDRHLLLTYNAKRLLKRLSDCPPDDQDRTIVALLLELPSGKVLARTEWRVHDREQYLWNLGHGRFLLRVRNTVSSFAPLANLASGHPFAERPLVTTRRRVEAILFSPDSDLMIVESRQPKTDALPDPGVPDVAVVRKPEPDPVQVDFFRVALPQSPGDEVRLQRAGQIFARGIGRVPANSSGYVAILDQGRQHWAFDFRLFTGKVKELAGFDSNCRPFPVLVSRSEFVAFGCHNGHTKQVIGAFNLRGEEMWQQNISEAFIAPTFDFASVGGRFAMSRLAVRDSAFAMDDSLLPELVGPQTVVVYQTDSGKQILRVDSSPIERAGQNFALSPDGMSLAVIRNEAIEVYPLPPLTGQEQKAVELAVKSAPEANDAAVQFGATSDAPESQATLSRTADSAATSASPGSTVNGDSQAAAAPLVDAATTAAGTANSAASTNTATTTSAAGETASAAPDATSSAVPASPEIKPDEQSAPRKPPTLYTLPGDKPEDSPQRQK
ncbi:hypothetical protein [Edaphobacter bradus]|uniref:hypothetical protein n=1 Tax=Edaphobacter bradus TaxID=2259016 RepID=UPI0021DFC129|nr:hypothetical protein [Edaphobacter bradus]